jgi:hypothetical protein
MFNPLYLVMGDWGCIACFIHKEDAKEFQVKQSTSESECWIKTINQEDLHEYI